jgi:DNA primase
MHTTTFYKKHLYLSQIYAEVIQACRTLLQEASEAKEIREYINSRVTQDNQLLFDFGWFPDNLNLSLLLDLVDKEKLQYLGLIYNSHVQDGDCRIYTDQGLLSKHNLIMSYRDLYGNLIALVGRTILSEIEQKENNIQKYKYTQGFIKSLNLFGLYQAKKEIFDKNHVFIVEGQIDCITCHQFGLTNTVALGGSSLSPFQFNMLRRFTDTFYLLLDSDAAGKKAAAKISKQYKDCGKVKILTIPEEFKDVDLCLKTKQSTEWIKEMLF